jgi:hypothetical protein
MKNVETFHPLSPMQAGMLYETLYAPGSGAYVGQVSFRLRGAFDLDSFRRAWRVLVDRHAALRTLFLWRGVSAPVQVVRREAEPPCEALDWRGVGAAEQETRLREYMEAERTRGFELTRAPLMRLAVITLDEGATHFVWSYHHLVVDGWSVTLLLDELAACFRAFAGGARTPPALPPARPFRDYIVWLNRQDAAEAERFWRRELESANVPTPVPARAAPEGATARERRRQVRLTPEEFAALGSFARRRRLTLNTVAQAAWGLLLGRLSGRDDVVFGATVSGRPPELPGVDTMIGMFVNTLPVRLSARESDALEPLLQSLQARQVESRRFEYCSLTQIQNWCDAPHGARLYESLLTFHNYRGRPSEGSTALAGGEASLGQLRAVSQVSYPLEIEVMPGGNAADLTLRYDSGRVEEATAERVLAGFAALLRGAAELPEAATVGDWLARLSAAERLRQEQEEEAFEQAAAQKLKGLKGLRARQRPGGTTTTKG